jgi:MFS transporter, FHS family, glucose/mannose:H+ symporter
MTSRRMLFVCACLGLLTFGVALTTLGAVLPSVIERFGIDKAAAGTLFLLLTFGILTGTMVFGPIVDRYGYKWMLVTATGLVVLGLEGIAFAGSLTLLRGAVLVIGFGGGIINGGSNALVADISTEGKAASLNLLGVFFGVGAMGVPLVLAALTGRFTHGTLIAVVGALGLIPLAVIASARFPGPKQAQGFPIAAAGNLVRDGVLLLMGLMLFVQSGLEITMGGWTSTFVSEELGVAERPALLILSLYWMGMMLARVALGFILRRAPAVPVLYGSLAIALAGAALLLTTRSATVAAAGVFLVGAGFAAMFPTVLSFIGERYVALSGTAFSLAIVMALIGGMLIPYTTGILGAAYGMRGSFLLVPAGLVALGVLLGVLSRALRPAGVR